ncbi:MAG: sulfatase-like hydrolase/transferase [Actinomycetota bacterium]
MTSHDDHQEGSAPVRNVLFIMCDQLRWDALSCAGQSLIDTPNIDRLAARGVRFDRAFVQGVVCGSSRMSYYTGRYVQSHGARWNQIPLRLGQRTMGDHLRPLGVRTVLIGKTHFAADRDGLARLGLDPDDPEVVYLAQCGFEPTERDDGLHPDRLVPDDLPYNRFLRANGFDEPNPWNSVANSVIDHRGDVVSGWLLRSSPHPAIVPDELSETAYMTDRAIDFMTEAGEERWCAHLSFIKPHWPYVVSDPYHRLVDPDDVPPAHRSPAERANEHPVLAAFRNARIGATFSRDEVRRAVVPAYLGLVAQIDHHLGRLFDAMARLGRLDDTMIVFTSDHGDYLGDHYQGDKDWFHEEAVRVPMIVVDPRPAADATRGTAESGLMEAVDLLPTFIDALGGDTTAAEPWLEGRSLVPLLHGAAPLDRSAAVSEADYGFLEMANLLPATDRPRDRRATMLRTQRYKYILSETGPNLLYDLDDDPDEFHDRIDDPALAAVQSELHEQLFTWFRTRAHDTTFGDADLRRRSTAGATARLGILIGYWDEDHLAQAMATPTP